MEDVGNEHFSRELMGTKSTSVDTTETHILEQAIETVYNRPEKHGEPEDTFGNIANVWSWYLDTEICDTDVAKMFILMKIARSKEGHYDEDNPEDVAGYAENWARLMEE
jgi:hypothetical protein